MVQRRETKGKRRVRAERTVDRRLGLLEEGSLSLRVFHARDGAKLAGTQGGTFTAGAWRQRDLNRVVTAALADVELLYELPYDGGTGTLPAEGEIVTGGTSGATCHVWRVTGTATAGTMFVTTIEGTFVDNEALTGDLGVAALVNNLVPEDTATGTDYANAIVAGPGTYRTLGQAPAYRVDGHRAQLYDNTAAAVILDSSSEFSASGSNHAPARAQIRGIFTLAVRSELIVRHWAQVTNGTNGFGVASNIGGLNEVYTEIEIWGGPG